MDEGNKRIHDLLAKMGIEAKIRLDSEHRRLIAIPTKQFQQHRASIENWLTLVGQYEDYSYFHERRRGTGDTGKLS